MNDPEPPHSIPKFFNRLSLRQPAEGQVITIEPFLTTSADHSLPQPDGWTLKTADGGPSARFEHTLVVTRGRPIVVTAV